jgi:hypothetical protein
MDDDEYDVVFTAEDFWTDIRAGHGAQSQQEDWVRENGAPETNDGRSITRTTFYPGDADQQGPGQAHRDPADRTDWQRLATINDGAYAKDRSRGAQNFRADKRRWLQTIANQIGATDHQHDRARWVLERMDFGPYQGARYPVEMVALGILSLLIDMEARSLETRAIEREEVTMILEDLEHDRRDLIDVRNKLREHDMNLLRGESDESL